VKKRLLVLGIGNPGREDDGLGYEFVLSAQRTPCETVEFHHAYQLNIEDAERIQAYENVLIVDAARGLQSPYELSPIAPKESGSFTTHSLSMPNVVAIAEELYSSTPACKLLAIRGQSFEMRNGLSAAGTEALQAALHFFWSPTQSNWLPGC
jgi:hydrogenase maturation protease